jgi:hypothetical protein
MVVAGAILLVRARTLLKPNDIFKPKPLQIVGDTHDLLA